MKKLSILLLISIQLILSGCFGSGCVGISGPYENCKLTEEQKSWVMILDSVQQFEYTNSTIEDSIFTDTLQGINRYLFTPDIFMGYECGNAWYQIAKNGLRIYKKDSTYLIKVFEENCYSVEQQLTEDGKEYDSLMVKGKLYKNVILKVEGYRKDSLWYSKGIGFVKIKTKERIYELLPY